MAGDSEAAASAVAVQEVAFKSGRASVCGEERMAKNAPVEAPSWLRRNLALIVVVAVVLMLLLMVWGMFNSFVTLNEDATKQWQNVETQYQRRVDLVPNLVSAVASYAKYENATLQQITAMRSQWAAARASEDTAGEMAAAQGIESGISRLLLVAENYPELKAGALYQDLMAQLEGTENRISVERTRYNEAVRNYNVAIKTFPGVMFAGMFGFKERAFFEAQPGAEVAPKVGTSTTLP